MKTTVLRALLLCGLMGAPLGHAQEWVNQATVSTTAGSLTANRLCSNDGRDLFCPAAAPTLNAATGGLVVSGTISATTISGTIIQANQFVGDGSLLTGLSTGGFDDDRIVSGTSSVFVQNNGAVSVTVAGGNVANFGSGGLGITNINASGLVQSAGVSSSGAISSSAGGYFGGSVGIGTAVPSSTLHVVGVSTTAGGITLGDTAGVTRMRMFPIFNNSTALRLNNGLLSLQDSGGTPFAIFDSSLRRTLLGGDGSASTTLHVSGTLRISNGGEACDVNRAGGIRYSSGQFEFCRGSVWESLGVLAGATTDRITSGTTTVFAANNGPVSFTVAGVNVANFGSGGLGITNINASGEVTASTLAATGMSGVSGSLVFRDQNGLLRARSTILVSATTGAVGIGAEPHSSVGPNGLLVTGHIWTGGQLYAQALTQFSDSNWRIQGQTGQQRFIGDDAGRYLAFNVSGSEAVRVVSTGLVGIGTQSPSYRLSVEGNTYVRGSLGLNNAAGNIFWITPQSSGNLLTIGAIGAQPASSGVLNILNTQYVGISTSTPRTVLDVSGTLRISNGGEACDVNRAGGIRYNAGNFEFCSGSAWTTLGDLAGATADRITSGTTTVVANNGGPVSFTVAGSNVANFGSGGLGITNINASGLIQSAGVSASAPISTTGGGYFGGSVGIGTSMPSSTLHVVSTANTSSEGITLGTFNNKHAMIYPVGTGSLAIEMNGGGGIFLRNNNATAFGSWGSSGMYIGLAGSQNPSTSLHVSGTLRISNGGEACDVNRAGGIRYSSGQFEFCRGSVWESLGVLAGATTDRITSGTTTVVANNGGPVSFTVAGVNVANFGSGGLGITNINASGLVQSAGVSSSGAISSSAGGYFGGSVGIGRLPMAGVSVAVSGGIDVAGNIGSRGGVWYSDGTNMAVRTPNIGAFYIQTISQTFGRLITGNTTINGDLSATGTGYFAGNVGIGTATPSTTLHVSGTLRISNGGEACDVNRAGGIRYNAGNFEFCSGSAWATLGDLAGATADRITSGTTTVVANNGGPVSFTVAGVNVANFGSGGLGITNINASGLIQSAGVSASAPISTTGGGYFGGNVGIKEANPSANLTITGVSTTAGGILLRAANSGGDRLRIYPAGNASALIRLEQVNGSLGLTNVSNNYIFQADAASLRLSVGGGNPSTTLDVSGTLRISNGGEACDVNRAGGIRYRAGNFEFCAGSAWTTLGDLAGATADRITSGTTTVVANNGGPVSFTVAGVNVANFGSGGLGITNVNASGLFSGVGVSLSAPVTGTAATFSGMVSATTVVVSSLQVIGGGGTCSTAADLGKHRLVSGLMQVCVSY